MTLGVNHLIITGGGAGGPGHPTSGDEIHHYYRQDLAPTASDPLQVGDLWSDTTANLLKRCTSVSPITFVSVEGSGGDVTGPASSVDNAIVRFDGVTGKIIQDYTSGAPTVSDTGVMTLNNTLDFNSGTIDLATQTVDVTLNNAVDALNFDSNTLSIDALNNRIGLGTASPASILEIVGSGIDADGGLQMAPSTLVSSAKMLFQAVDVSGDLILFFGNNLFVDSSLVTSRFDTGELAWGIALDCTGNDMVQFKHFTVAGVEQDKMALLNDGSLMLGNALSALPAFTGALWSFNGGSEVQKIGAITERATTEGTRHIDLFNGTAPVGTLTNGISLYATGGEPAFLDAAANSHVINAPSANGTVATVLGSLGPVGSNTTVQEWLTVTINGTIRFIPCF